MEIMVIYITKNREEGLWGLKTSHKSKNFTGEKKAWESVIILAHVILGLKIVMVYFSALSFVCIILSTYSPASDHMNRLFLQLQSSCFKRYCTLTERTVMTHISWNPFHRLQILNFLCAVWPAALGSDCT